MGFYRGLDSKRKGKVIEFSGLEKAEKAVTKIMGTTKDGKYYIVDKVVVDEAKAIPNSTAIEDEYQNNTYLVSGKVWYKSFDVVLDKILPSKVSDFSLEYTDTRDGFKLPDIELINLIIK